MNRILVLAPHPDDESIGCGGTLCRHVQQGDEVHVVFLTSGEKGGHGRSEAATIQVREAEAHPRGARVLGGNCGHRRAVGLAAIELDVFEKK